MANESVRFRTKIAKKFFLRIGGEQVREIFVRRRTECERKDARDGIHFAMVCMFALYGSARSDERCGEERFNYIDIGASTTCGFGRAGLRTQTHRRYTASAPTFAMAPCCVAKTAIAASAINGFIAARTFAAAAFSGSVRKPSAIHLLVDAENDSCVLLSIR
jgi:ribosomal protein L37E